MATFNKYLFFLNPKNWLAGMVLGCLWLITRLPNTWQLGVGRFMGNTIYCCAPKLRHITATNISLCFPDLTLAKQQTLIKNNFISLGIGLIETARAWWLPEHRLAKCTIKLTGLEHAEEAFARGKGIILLSPHATCLEMVGRLLGSRYTFGAMYRPHKIPLVAKIQERFRKKYRIKHIARHRMRELLQSFQDNMAIWYAYDVDAGVKRSVFAPFFGIQTASMTAVSRIVTLTGAAVVPIEFYRLPDGWDYEINLFPALQNFPGDNLTDDATRLNTHLEKAIRNKPEQYIWQYKRFKTRPGGEKRFY